MLQYKFDTDSTNILKELRTQVDNYFATHNSHPAGGWKLFVKGLFQVLTAIGLYITLVFFTPITPVAIALCMLLGLNFAVIGFNIMHEGGHQTFSRVSWLNNVASYFLNVLGGTIYYWKRKHNINHHTYTNIEGMDSDIDVKPFMRLHEDQPLRWYHRFQHIYGFVLYGVSYIAWIFYDDFQKYVSGKITATSNRKRLPLKQHFIFWTTKLTYIGIYMAVPILMVGWVSWLVGFLIATFTCGLAISIVFQLAHVVEDTEFHTTESQKSHHEWAVHQLASTANFATGSKVLYWLLGGLNFQIEHHLFPRISHIHYPEISKVIRKKCQEYQIDYHEYATMPKAIMSHLRHLKKLGRTQELTTVKVRS